jgi:hypothetical protein
VELSVPSDSWSNRLSRGHYFRPVGNAPRSFRIEGTPSLPDLPYPSLGGETCLEGEFTTQADDVSTGAVANLEGMVTADLQTRLIALEDETTSLMMVINHL